MYRATRSAAPPKPEEILGAGYINLRHEEVKVGGKRERRGEIQVALDLLPRHRPVAAGRLTGDRMDAVRLHGISRGQAGLQHLAGEREGSAGGATVIERHIGRRIDPRRHLVRGEGRRSGSPTDVRIFRENAVDFKDEAVDVGGSRGTGAAGYADSPRTIPDHSSVPGAKR